MATETVHRQHQAVDKNYNITVRTGCRRPKSLERSRQSSDGGQRSNMICRKEEVSNTKQTFTLSHDAPRSSMVHARSPMLVNISSCHNDSKLKLERVL